MVGTLSNPLMAPCMVFIAGLPTSPDGQPDSDPSCVAEEGDVCRHRGLAWFIALKKGTTVHTLLPGCALQELYVVYHLYVVNPKIHHPQPINIFMVGIPTIPKFGRFMALAFPLCVCNWGDVQVGCKNDAARPFNSKNGPQHEQIQSQTRV